MSTTTSAESLISLDDLFTGFSLGQFVDQYLHCLPFALPGATKPICDWGSWQTLEPMLQSADADIMLVRSNERYVGATPATLADARALSEQGYTILIRHAERHHTGIARLTTQFAATFRGKGDAHIYATPADHYGFAWHYDAEDVFVLQLAGEKEFDLRKNTVNPWPLEETLPVDMQYEREIMPLIRVKLQAGDMLYIPCGYWHRATASATGETAFSLAVGVMSRSALDVFDLLRSELPDSILWRQRLPMGSGETDESGGSTYQQILESLAEDFSKRITSLEFRKKLEAAAFTNSP